MGVLPKRRRRGGPHLEGDRAFHRRGGQTDARLARGADSPQRGTPAARRAGRRPRPSRRRARRPTRPWTSPRVTRPPTGARPTAAPPPPPRSTTTAAPPPTPPHTPKSTRADSP